MGDVWFVTVEDETDGSIEMAFDCDPCRAPLKAAAPFLEG
jgi:hypothetical protein